VLYGFICLNDPVNLVDPWGLAERQERPLDIFGLRHITFGPFHHDSFAYDDGTNSGYYADSRVRPDNASQDLMDRYHDVGGNLQDDVLRQAEQNVRDQWDQGTNPNAEEYKLFTHNCQDYADAVIEEYNRLIAERNNQNNTCP